MLFSYFGTFLSTWSIYFVCLFQALTSASANDVVNLERLETLGDSYLKFMASFFLFLHLDEMDEGKLTEIKGKMIGNRNLYYSGVHHKLSGYLKVQDFGPSDWMPPGIHVHPEIQQVCIVHTCL